MRVKGTQVLINLGTRTTPELAAICERMASFINPYSHTEEPLIFP